MLIAYIDSFEIENVPQELLSKTIDNSSLAIYLTLIWMGFFRGSFWGEGGGTITLCLKLARVTLETSNFARNYTHKLVSEKISFIATSLLILLLSAFFGQKLTLFGQNSTFT